MLDALRKSAGGIVAKIFIALLVLSFAVWGIADVFRNFGQNTIASVGSAEIKAEDFQRTYQREVQNLSRQIGQPLTPQQAAAFGVPGQVLGRAIAEATFDHMAKDMNLGISNDALVSEIHKDPMFRGPDGRFDRSRMQQLLAANGYSEDEYIRTRISLARRHQIAEGLAGASVAPDTMVEAIHQYRNEERAIQYVVLTRDTAGEVADPSADELQSYFEENKTTYRAPEYRKLDLVVIDPAAVARPQEVTEDEARQAYEQSQSRFGQPEKRQVLQLAFKDKAAADAAAARLASGESSFEDLVVAQDLQVSDVDLGLITRDKIIDPKIAEAAFSLESGATSEVIEGRFAPVLVKVTKVEEAAVQPFEEVSETLKLEIATRRAEGEVLDLYDEIEDARAGGATLTEVAERFNLKLRTVDAVDTQGNDMAGSTVELPEGGKLLPEAFRSEVGEETAPVQLGTRGFVWFDIKDVIADRDRSLDEVREAVVTDWKAAQVRDRLGEEAKAIEAKLSEGADLAGLAAEKGLEVQTASGLKRETSSDGLPADAVNAAFAGSQGHVATATTDDGHEIVLQVTDITVPPFFNEAADVTALSKEMATVMQTSLIGQYIAGVQEDLGVKVNQGAVNLAIGVGSAGS